MYDDLLVVRGMSSRQCLGSATKCGDHKCCTAVGDWSPFGADLDPYARAALGSIEAGQEIEGTEAINGAADLPPKPEAVAASPY